MLYNGFMAELIKLSPKHQAFVDKYLECWNGTQSYKFAYPGASDNTARNNAALLLAKDGIRAHIQARLSELHMSADEALARMTDIAKARITDFYTGDGNELDLSLFDTDPDGNLVPKRNAGLIKRIKIKRSTTQFGESVETELELHSAQRAQEKILELNGKFGNLTKEPVSGGASLQENTRFYLPADVIAPSFFSSYRAIKSGKYYEFCEYGGRGSTKSSFISLVIIELIKNNPDTHALVMRQIGNTLRDSVLAQLRWAISELGLSDQFKVTTNPMEITYIPTGQKIYFRGGDDPGKIKSIKTTFGYIGILWFEELDQFYGAEAIRKIEQSIRGGEKVYKFKSWNPPRTSASWVNRYIQIPKAGMWVHSSDYRSVPEEWLGQPWLDEAKHLQAVNPGAYEHEYLGVSNGTGGQIFENVECRKISDDEIAQFDHVLHGLDWGYFPDPLSYGKMHYDAARMILYIFGEYRANKQSNRQVWDALLKNNLTTTGDLIIADSAEPKSIADFRDYGANIRGAEKGPDSVDYSIKWLASRAKIVIDPERAPYHAQEFLEYELEQDKNGEFISAYPDKNNHAIDDTRYATNLIWRKKGL